jgi:subtilase family serine protease
LPFILPILLPDLAVTFVTGQPLSAKVGSRFSVVDSIANQGAVSAPASTTRIYLSKDTIKGPGDVIIGSHTVPALSPSGQAGEATSGAAIVAIPINTAPGAYHVIACADDTNLVKESSEANNCRAVIAAMQVTK